MKRARRARRVSQRVNSGQAASRPYVCDVGYHSSFQPGQSPLVMSYVAATAGWAPPDPAQPFAYLELGCGSGATLNGLAAAFPLARFTGVDFNAGSIAEARAGAAAAGLGNVSYVEAAFSTLDVGAHDSVDYVACHGTWSWLDAAEKDAVLGIVRALLRRGGLLYLGYVTLGRAAVTPMWQVLRRLAPASGDSVGRLKAGISLLAALRDHGALYPQQNPQAASVLAEVDGRRMANDLAALDNLSHNLLSDNFHIELLDDIVGRLAAAEAAFCGSAQLQQNDPDLCVPAGLRSRHDELPTRVAQELFKDFLHAPLARTDVFMRGAGRDPVAAGAWLRERIGAVLAGDFAEGWRQVEAARWSETSRPALRFAYERVASGVGSLADITHGAPHDAATLTEAMRKLIACAVIVPCLLPVRPIAGEPAMPRPANRYNHVALDAASAGMGPVLLAAPALGGCLTLTFPTGLLLATMCTTGPGASLHDAVLARVARMPGVPPAVCAQLANPAFFAQLQAPVATRVLPLLLRVGALV